MDNIESFILAGGASSRMGTDKSQLLIGNQTFIQRIAKALRAIASDVTLVGAASDHSSLKTAADIYPRWGALGGLHAALNACTTEWALVVACDLPFVTSELFERLYSARDESDAVVPVQPDERPQPLCAFYRIEPCLVRATNLIQAGQRRPLDLLNSVNTRWMPFQELKDLKHSEKFFVNINTPEDYDEATRSEAAEV
jgi:molybdenum cofactor guanylyltransferase